MKKIILILGLGLSLSCFANNMELDRCTEIKNNYEKLNNYVEFLKEKKDFEKAKFFSQKLESLKKMKERECK